MSDNELFLLLALQVERINLDFLCKAFVAGWIFLGQPLVGEPLLCFKGKARS